MEAVESELHLDRQSLIRMALLLGSDYTDGVRGVGVVNALEILRAFPTESDLVALRNWIYTPDNLDGCLRTSPPSRSTLPKP